MAGVQQLVHSHRHCLRPGQRQSMQHGRPVTWRTPTSIASYFPVPSCNFSRLSFQLALDREALTLGPCMSFLFLVLLESGDTVSEEAASCIGESSSGACDERL